MTEKREREKDRIEVVVGDMEREMGVPREGPLLHQGEKSIGRLRHVRHTLAVVTVTTVRKGEGTGKGA